MKVTRIALALALAGISIGAQATNGMFSHGYGMKAKGMGGAATTNTEDAFFGANNPAAAAFVGNRVDLGADLFSPIREVTSTDFGPFGNVESDSNYFVIPEFGYNKSINSNLSLGVSIFGNGGMNTDYPVTALGINVLGAPSSLNIDLMQLIIAPTAAYKIAPNHSIGISPLIGYQRMKIEGAANFAGFSAFPLNVTNNGYDDAFGFGVRVGYMGKITPTVTIGAAYSSKINFQEFDKYKGFLAEQGDLDLPENYNVGLAWQATPEVKLALDYQRINYSGVNAIGNPAGNTLLIPGAAFGTDNGSGFGWADMDIWKLGVEYKYNKAWTLRAGYSHGDSPIDGAALAEAMFNIFAPGIIEDHVTLGFTHTLASGDELTVAYMHGFENDVSGTRPGAPFGAGTDTSKMYQNSLGIQYSWKM